MAREIELELESHPDSVPQARYAVRSLVQEAEFPQDVAEDVAVLTTEVVAEAVSRSAEAALTLRAHVNDEVAVEVRYRSRTPAEWASDLSYRVIKGLSDRLSVDPDGDVTRIRLAKELT